MKMKSLLLVTLATLGLTASTKAQNLPNYVPANGLVGWWPFNGNAVDESGNGIDGAVNGATLTEDRFGLTNSSYYFNNSEITVDIPNSQFANDFSISSWVKLDNYSGLNPDAYYYPTFMAHQNSALIMQIELYQSVEKFLCYFLINPGIPGQQAEDGHVFTTQEVNNWSHIVLANSGGVNTLYVNGVLADVSNSPSTLQGIEPGSFLKFGNFDASPNILYKGKIDDIGIWSRALSQQEITDLYNGNICYQTITVTDTLLINMGITGFNPVTYNNTIKIFPNPANNHITIDYGNFATMNGYQLKIENSLGQQLFQTNITQQTDYLSLNNWGGNGLYFVHIIDAQGNTIDIRKIVLQ